MKKLLLSLAVAGVAVASLSAKTVTFSNLGDFKLEDPRLTENPNSIADYYCTVDDTKMLWHGTKPSANPQNFTIKSGFYLLLAAPPAECTLQSLNIPVVASDTDRQITVFYSTKPIAPLAFYRTKFTYTLPANADHINIDFTTDGDGVAADQTHFTIISESNIVFSAPITLKLASPNDSEVQKLQAPTIQDAMGYNMENGSVVANGSYVYFTNPNATGSVYAATQVDGVWGDYTEIAAEDGIEIYGEPGAAVGIRAYVKGATEAEDSEVTELTVTIAENWASPTFMIGEVAYTELDNLAENVLAGSMVTIVNPTNTGCLHVVLSDGDTLYGEPGDNMEVQVPDALVDDEPWQIVAEVTGVGKGNSDMVTLTVVSIVKENTEPTDPSGVAAIEANASATYFNLQGVQIARPTHGAYIVVSNGKAHKIVK